MPNTEQNTIIASDQKQSNQVERDQLERYNKTLIRATKRFYEKPTVENLRSLAQTIEKECPEDKNFSLTDFIFSKTNENNYVYDCSFFAIALMSSNMNEEILAFLKEKCSELNIDFNECAILQDKEEFYKLYPLSFAIVNNNKELIKLLIQNGASLTKAQDLWDNIIKLSPIGWITKKDNNEVGQWLIEEFLESDKKAQIINDHYIEYKEFKMSLLAFAATNNNYECIELLIRNGVDLNKPVTISKNGISKTFLAYMVDIIEFENESKELSANEIELFKFLIENHKRLGIDIDAIVYKNEEKKIEYSLLSYIIAETNFEETNIKELVEFAIKHGASLTKIVDSCADGLKKAPIAVIIEQGKEYLEWLISFLKENNIEINLNANVLEYPDGKSNIMINVLNNSDLEEVCEEIRFLIANGLDPNLPVSIFNEGSAESLMEYLFKQIINNKKQESEYKKTIFQESQALVSFLLKNQVEFGLNLNDTAIHSSYRKKGKGKVSTLMSLLFKTIDNKHKEAEELFRFLVENHEKFNIDLNKVAVEYTNGESKSLLSVLLSRFLFDQDKKAKELFCFLVENHEKFNIDLDAIATKHPSGVKFSLLSNVLMENCQEVAEILINNGASLTKIIDVYMGGIKECPLMSLAKQRSLELGKGLIEFLITKNLLHIEEKPEEAKAGLYLNSYISFANGTLTLLAACAFNDNYNFIEYLITKGANPNKNIAITQEGEGLSLTGYILKNNNIYNNQNFKELELFISKHKYFKLDLNAVASQTNDGSCQYNLLGLIIRLGLAEKAQNIVQLLINNSDLNAIAQKFDGKEFNAMGAAIYEENTKLVKLFHNSNKFDLNSLTQTIDGEKFSAIGLAIFQENQDIFNILKPKRNIDLNLIVKIDKDGKEITLEELLSEKQDEFFTKELNKLQKQQRKENKRLAAEESRKSKELAEEFSKLLKETRKNQLVLFKSYLEQTPRDNENSPINLEEKLQEINEKLKEIITNSTLDEETKNNLEKQFTVKIDKIQEVFREKIGEKLKLEKDNLIKNFIEESKSNPELEIDLEVKIREINENISNIAKKYAQINNDDIFDDKGQLKEIFQVNLAQMLEILTKKSDSLKSELESLQQQIDPLLKIKADIERRDQIFKGKRLDHLTQLEFEKEIKTALVSKIESYLSKFDKSQKTEIIVKSPTKSEAKVQGFKLSFEEFTKRSEGDSIEVLQRKLQIFKLKESKVDFEKNKNNQDFQELQKRILFLEKEISSKSSILEVAISQEQEAEPEAQETPENNKDNSIDSLPAGQIVPTITEEQITNQLLLNLKKQVQSSENENLVKITDKNRSNLKAEAHFFYIPGYNEKGMAACSKKYENQNVTEQEKQTSQYNRSIRYVFMNWLLDDDKSGPKSDSGPAHISNITDDNLAKVLKAIKIIKNIQINSLKRFLIFLKDNKECEDFNDISPELQRFFDQGMLSFDDYQEWAKSSESPIVEKPVREVKQAKTIDIIFGILKHELNDVEKKLLEDSFFSYLGQFDENDEKAQSDYLKLLNPEEKNFQNIFSQDNRKALLFLISEKFEELIKVKPSNKQLFSTGISQKLSHHLKIYLEEETQTDVDFKTPHTIINSAFLEKFEYSSCSTEIS